MDALDILVLQGIRGPGMSWNVLEIKVSWNVLEFFEKLEKCPGKTQPIKIFENNLCFNGMLFFSVLIVLLELYFFRKTNHLLVFTLKYISNELKNKE